MNEKKDRQSVAYIIFLIVITAVLVLFKSGKYYSFQEIQDFYGVSRTTLVTWIREEGIPTIDVGRAKRVRKDVFDDVLRSKRKVEGDT